MALESPIMWLLFLFWLLSILSVIHEFGIAGNTARYTIKILKEFENGTTFYSFVFLWSLQKIIYNWTMLSSNVAHMLWATLTLNDKN